MNRKSGVSQIRGHEQEFRSKVSTNSGLLPGGRPRIRVKLSHKAICSILYMLKFRGRNLAHLAGGKTGMSADAFLSSPVSAIRQLSRLVDVKPIRKPTHATLEGS